MSIRRLASSTSVERENIDFVWVCDLHVFVRVCLCREWSTPHSAGLRGRPARASGGTLGTGASVGVHVPPGAQHGSRGHGQWTLESGPRPFQHGLSF